MASSNSSPTSLSTPPPLLSPTVRPLTMSPPTSPPVAPVAPPSPPPKHDFARSTSQDVTYQEHDEEDLGSKSLKLDTPLFRDEEQAKKERKKRKGKERASNELLEYPPESEGGEEETRRIEQNLRQWSNIEKYRRASIRRSAQQPSFVPPISNITSVVGEVSRRGSLLLRRGGSIRSQVSVNDDADLEAGRRKRSGTLERVGEDDEDGEEMEDMQSPRSSGDRDRDRRKGGEPRGDGLLKPEERDVAMASGSSSPSPEERTERARKAGSKFAEHLQSVIPPDASTGYAPSPSKTSTSTSQLYDAPTAEEKSKRAKGKGKSGDSGGSGDTLIAGPSYRSLSIDRPNLYDPRDRESLRSFDSHITLEGKSVASHAGTIGDPLVPGRMRSENYNNFDSQPGLAYRKSSPDPNVFGGRRRKGRQRDGSEEDAWDDDDRDDAGRRQKGFMEWVLCGCFGVEEDDDEQAGRTNPMG
ncbi:hypothetical protein BT69DRAFT_1338637 [Atractiella rhizophila]|nr:hypothetical protein BT69DRAFT_1338637 [Atractiella rhizophila]